MKETKFKHMKIPKWTIVCVFCLACILLSSCVKEESPQLTNQESLLVSITWKLNSFKLNGTEMIIDCAKDNTLNFYENGTYATDTGTLICIDSDLYDSDVNSGRWRLTNSGNTLELRHDNPSYDYDAILIELTKTRLVLKVEFPSGGVVEQTYIS